MNSNSEDPNYLIAKKNPDGSLQIQNVNDFGDHKIGYEINLKYDSNGNVKSYNDKESNCLIPVMESKYDVWQKETLASNGYPNPQKDAYLMMKLRKTTKLPEALQGKSFNFAKCKLVQSNHHQPIRFVRLTELIENIVP